MDKPQTEREQDEFNEIAMTFAIDKGENLFENQRAYALRIYSLAIKHAKERKLK